MDGTEGIVSFISSSLESGNYKEALNVINEKRKERFSDYCYEVVAVVIEKILDDTIILKPSLYGACEQLISSVLEKCSPDDALLEFIERLELAKNDAQFGIILPVIQQLLQKVMISKKKSIEWVLYAISNYIEKIKLTEHQLEDDERKLIDNDLNIRRITKVYTMVIAFYQPFVVHIISVNDCSVFKTKQVLSEFLISLLGKPMIFIDIDPNANAKSEARQACQIIIQDICKLQNNVLKFLSNLEYKEKTRHRYTDGSELSPFETCERMNMTTYSGFFYVVYSGHFEIPDTAIPQVYNTKYVIHTLMLVVNHLLRFTEYGPLAKALALYEALNNRLGENTSHQLLSASVHYDLCKRLVNVAIYCNYQTLRKTAIKSISKHIKKFDFKGRCILIKYLIESSNHSGMIGYAINLYKETIIEAFKEPTLHECFNRVHLTAMIKKMCHLPHGAESDLMELADQIITALNFLRFLVLKDKDNISGIRDIMPIIETEYLEVLVTALKMSKAHYELKLKDVIEGKYQPGVTLTVGGTVLDSIPAEGKIEIIESALNAFHLIEGLVARLNECFKSYAAEECAQSIMLRAGRRVPLPLTNVPVSNFQRIIRSHSDYAKEHDLKVHATTPAAEQDEQQYEENVKTRILERALEFVPKTGWSIESLSAGAKAAGYPTIAHGLFPNGGGDLVHYFNVKCNEQLVELMKTWPKEDLKERKVPAMFVENAIVTRLLMIDPYKSTWPKAMALQTMPSNVPNCLATLLSLVDDICYHSGDRSVDFNWYVRRVGLAGIYKTAELFYLTDKSSDHSATRSFVSSRIRDAQLVQMALDLNPVAAAPQTLSAAFVTAKNILGINPLK